MNELKSFKRKANFHTHSTFCDGKNTLEEMLLAGLDCGLDALGFSSHAMYPFAGDCHIAIKDFENYISEITRLKLLYKNKIQIFCGYEVEYLPFVSFPCLKTYKSELNADFIIGSVHYLAPKANFKPFAVDWKAEIIADCAEKCFAGNYKRLVEFYFETVREMIKYTSFDFVAHLDLIRKLNGILHFFDENASWYKKEIKKTARLCGEKKIIAEINTGAISRGVMNDVYPSKDFLAELYKCDVPIVINSDAHNASGIVCAFNRAVNCAKTAGYKGSMQLFWENNKPTWQFVPFAE